VCLTESESLYVTTWVTILGPFLVYSYALTGPAALYAPNIVYHGGARAPKNRALHSMSRLPYCEVCRKHNNDVKRPDAALPTRAASGRLDEPLRTGARESDL
jgi:hypothetical protein